MTLIASISDNGRVVATLTDTLITTESPGGVQAPSIHPFFIPGQDRLKFRATGFRQKAQIVRPRLLVNWSGDWLKARELVHSFLDATSSGTLNSYKQAHKEILENYGSSDVAVIFNLIKHDDGEAAPHLRRAQVNCQTQKIGRLEIMAGGLGAEAVINHEDFASWVGVRSREKLPLEVEGMIIHLVSVLYSQEILSESFSAFRFGGCYEVSDIYNGDWRKVPYGVYFHHVHTDGNIQSITYCSVLSMGNFTFISAIDLIELLESGIIRCSMNSVSPPFRTDEFSGDFSFEGTVYDWLSSSKPQFEIHLFLEPKKGTVTTSYSNARVCLWNELSPKRDPRELFDQKLVRQLFLQSKDAPI